jgi:hypothetical protein
LEVSVRIIGAISSSRNNSLDVRLVGDIVSRESREDKIKLVAV